MRTIKYENNRWSMSGYDLLALLIDSAMGSAQVYDNKDKEFQESLAVRIAAREIKNLEAYITQQDITNELKEKYDNEEKNDLRDTPNINKEIKLMLVKSKQLNH